MYIFASLELLGMGGQGLHIASGAPKEFLLEKLSVQRKTYHKNWDILRQADQKREEFPDAKPIAEKTSQVVMTSCWGWRKPLMAERDERKVTTMTSVTPGRISTDRSPWKDLWCNTNAMKMSAGNAWGLWCNIRMLRNQICSNWKHRFGTRHLETHMTSLLWATFVMQRCTVVFATFWLEFLPSLRGAGQL